MAWTLEYYLLCRRKKGEKASCHGTSCPENVGWPYQVETAAAGALELAAGIELVFLAWDRVVYPSVDWANQTGRWIPPTWHSIV